MTTPVVQHKVDNIHQKITCTELQAAVPKKFPSLMLV